MYMQIDDIFLARITEIENCLNEKMYFAALSLALTLPDICGKAEYPQEGVGNRYKKWYQNNVEHLYMYSDSPYNDKLPYLNNEVVYSLRNCFLHAGNPNVEKSKIGNDDCKIDQFEIKFTNSLLGDMSSVSMGKVVKRRYILNGYLLCKRLCRCAKEYYLENKEKFNFFEYNVSIES